MDVKELKKKLQEKYNASIELLNNHNFTFGIKRDDIDRAYRKTLEQIDKQQEYFRKNSNGYEVYSSMAQKTNYLRNRINIAGDSFLRKIISIDIKYITAILTLESYIISIIYLIYFV